MREGGKKEALWAAIPKGLRQHTTGRAQSSKGLGGAQEGASMTTHDLAIRKEQGTENVIEIGRLLAQSGYFTDIKDAAQAVAKILAGREVGIGPIASLGGVYIQNG